MSLRGQRGVKLLILATLCVAASGCSSIGFIPTPAEKILPKLWESAELIGSLSQRQAQFRSVRTLASIQYSGPDGRGGFQEAILVQRPDRLRLETLTYLGSVLIVTVDGKEIVGFHPREGLFFRGQSSPENLLRYTQIPLELAEVTALLLGLPPVDAQAPWEKNGNALVWSYSGAGKDVVTFDGQAPLPSKWERFDYFGDIALSAEFSDYTETPAGFFPLKVSVEAHAKGKRLEIRYQEPELNVPIPVALFTQEKPANAKEVPLDAIGG